MGRHGVEGSRRVRWVAAGGAAVIVLGGAAAVAAQVMDGGSGSSGATSSTSSSPSGTTTEAATTTTQATSTTATSTGPPPAATQALNTCRTQVRAGERLATAAAASARDWGAHVRAQVKLDAGRISFAEAEREWAASKKPAAADLAAFASAQTAYNAGRQGCAKTVVATGGTQLAGAGLACAVRASALDLVARKGAAVNAQWKAHVAQMATKAHDAGPAYHARWMTFVATSKPVLAAYGSAASALTRAPRCS